MRATDIDLSRDLALDPKSRVATFYDTRMVIFAADALGLLRQDMVDEIGVAKARELFLRFGYQTGFADHLQLKVNFDFDNDEELLAAGPLIHSWEGIVQATPTKVVVDMDRDEFHHAGIWTNSYEADQFLSYHPPGDEPVCWSLAGYASGYATAWYGRPIVAVEPVCRGRGDEQCQWLLRRTKDCGPEARDIIAALETFWR